MKDATELFQRHRECVRSIWNAYFCRDAIEWDERDLFADAEARLFEAQVLFPLGRHNWQYRPDYMSPHEVMSFIRVVPATAAEVLVNREIGSGYWDWRHPLPRAEVGDFDFRMFHFFDWGLLEPRNYEYVRVWIADSSRYPEAKGKHALIKSDEVRFLCDDAV